MRRHIYLVVSQREWGFISSVMNGKVNQVLAQQRGFVDLEFFLKSRSSFVADIADCIKSLFLPVLYLVQNRSDFGQLACFELFDGLAENQAPAQFFKINNRFLVHEFIVS